MTSHSGSCGACAFFDQHRGASAPDGLWPVVTDADWCGHFAPETTGASIAAE